MLKLEEVTKLKDQVLIAYDQGTEEEGCTLNQKWMEDLISCLEWTEEQLNQRRVNSRKYLNKQKVVNRLLKEHLSEDELKAIDDQAREAAERGK